MKQTLLFFSVLLYSLMLSAQIVTPGGYGVGFSNPMTTAGDLIDGGTAGSAQRLAGCASGMLVYSALSIPGCSSTLPSGLTIPGFAPLASPSLTGSPTAPTQATGDTSTDIATDAFVANAIGIGAAVSGSPAANGLLYTDSSGKLRSAANITQANGDQITLLQNSLGASTANAVVLLNNAAAASGAQQNSPALSECGNGWGTTGSASESVCFYSFTLPIQGTVPSGGWYLYSSVNGGTGVYNLAVLNNGQLYVPGPAVNITGTSSVKTGTSGTATCYMSMQGAALKIASCYLNAYQETSTAQTYSYPVAFSTTPVLEESGGSCGTYNPTTTASTLTLPANASMTSETCNIVLIGQ